MKFNKLKNYLNHVLSQSMMKYTLIFLLGILMGMGLVTTVSSRFDSSILASWVGAIATFGATGVALWVANKKKRPSIKLHITLKLNYSSDNPHFYEQRIVPNGMSIEVGGYNYGDLGDAIEYINFFDWTVEHDLFHTIKKPINAAQNELFYFEHFVDDNPYAYFETPLWKEIGIRPHTGMTEFDTKSKCVAEVHFYSGVVKEYVVPIVTTSFLSYAWKKKLVLQANDS